MPLQASGAISLSQVQTEFGGSNPISINEYYRSGGLVPNTATNAAVPTSGQISFSQFYGTSVISDTITLTNTTFVSQSSLSARLDLTFGTAGDIFITRTGFSFPGTFDVGDWITPKSSAPSDYQIFVSQTNNGGTLSGESFNTWLTLSAGNRTWIYTSPPIGGFFDALLTVSIRKGTGTTLATAVYTLSLENYD